MNLRTLFKKEKYIEIYADSEERCLIHIAFHKMLKTLNFKRQYFVIGA